MMKTAPSAICAAFLITSLIACSKSAKSSIVGKWSIVSDSSSLPIANTVGSNYIGTSGDYYNFAADGSVYISEDSVTTTASYSLKPNNELTITYTNGSISPYQITNLTAHTATFSYIYALGPTRILNLKR